MDNSKDIRFTNKKIDESWKEQASREKETLAVHPASTKAAAPDTQNMKIQETSQTLPTSKEFINLLSSLSYQAMMHLGEIPDPGTGQKEVNLEAAKEIIDLLIIIQKKTDLRVSKEEASVFSSVLPELQMKYSQLA